MLKRRSKIIAVVFFIVVIGVLAFLFLGRQPKIEYTTTKAVRGELRQTVSETGMVKADNEIDLNFPAGGKIAKIYAAVGDKVKKDQVLAELDSSDLILKEKEAIANLQVAQANYAKLAVGATASELAVSQANLNQARIAHLSALNELDKVQATVNESISQAEKNLSDLDLTTGNTITSYQQAVRNYQAVALTTMEAKLAVANTALDNIDTVLSDNDAKNYLGAGNSTLIETTKTDYNQAVPALATAQASLNQAKAAAINNTNINQASTDALACLNLIFSALKNCYNLLEVSIAGGSFTQTKLDTHKTNISTQQTNISTGVTAVQTAQHNLNDSINNLNNAILAAKNALATACVTGAQQIAAAQAKVDNTYRAWQVADAQYSQLKAGTRSQDLNLAQAQVSQAQAAWELVRNQISNNTIKAPLDGTITKKNYEAGEQSSSAKSIFSLLGANNFAIEVDVSEADITKVAVGNPVIITLDAFGEDVKFDGRVNFIEPAETVIQDVIYYKVKINFEGRDKDVKSGMTANANIATASKSDALIVPARAIIEKNGKGKFIRLLANNELKEIPVTIGLRGDNGLVEVLSGVNEGDAAVTYVKQNN